MYNYLINNWLEWFGVISGLLYLYLEIKQHTTMWVVGFISSLVYVFVFFESKFYADTVLNVYFASMSVYGFWLWKFVAAKENLLSSGGIEYKNLKNMLIVKLIVSSFSLWVVISQVLVRFTDSPVPYGDAFVSALSVVATWMVARKYIEHWFVWVVVNVVSVYLFVLRGLNPTAFLYVIYTILSVIGYLHWRKNDSISPISDS